MVLGLLQKRCCWVNGGPGIPYFDFFHRSEVGGEMSLRFALSAPMIGTWRLPRGGRSPSYLPCEADVRAERPPEDPGFPHWEAARPPVVLPVSSRGGVPNFGTMDDLGSPPAAIPIALGVPTASTRRSRRIAKGANATVFERAVTRKIALTEGTSGSAAAKGGVRSRAARAGGLQSGEGRVKRILDKSALCGVSLSVSEARSVNEFIRGAA